MTANALSRKLENLADQSQEISLRELLTKIYIRPLLFWSCIVIPTLLALLLTALVPTDWTASVKIMLRYGSSESSFLQGLIPENRASLSGASSAEILRSMPTLIQTIRDQDIRDEDIYKKPHEVLGGHLSGLLENYFPSEMPPGLPGVDPRTMLLAKAFKDSLQEKSGGASKKKPVEVLEKSSQLPPSMKGDELITVSVRSFNREKVAQMANGLAEAFISEYYRVSAEEARRSYLFLDELVTKATADVEKVKRGLPPSDILKLPESGGTATPSPLVDSMSRELTVLQGRLAEAEDVYAENSEQVQRLRNQVAKLRAELPRQERIDHAREVLEQIKLRRYQAENTEKLYTHKLIPISIVEPAFTPKKSFSKVAVRFVIAGGVGMVLGLILGLGLIIVLDVTDPRLHTSWQLRERLGLPILATLPDLGKKAARDLPGSAASSSQEMVSGLLQMASQMQDDTTRHGIIAVSSAARGEGKTFVSLALGGALAQGGRHRCLLVDVCPGKGSLSAALGHAGTPGYAEALAGNQAFAQHIVRNAYRGCDLLPAGAAATLSGLGFYESALREQFEALRGQYDYVVIDAGPLNTSTEALLCSRMADKVLLVAAAGLTRRPLIAHALNKLRELGIAAQGVVFNRKRDVLPAILYRNV